MTNTSNDMPLTVDLYEGRHDGASTWDLPPWGHPLGAGVYPLLIHLPDRLIPIGTAFCISRLGIVVTASHNAREALKLHPRGERLLQREELPSHLHLGKVSLSLLHNWLTEQNRLQLSVWPLEGAYGAQPTDLLFAFANHQEKLPRLPLSLSFALPRIGSKVLCVGYCDTVLQEALPYLVWVRVTA